MQSRAAEAGAFKATVEQARFRGKQEIPGKHKHMEDQLSCSVGSHPDTLPDA